MGRKKRVDEPVADAAQPEVDAAQPEVDAAQPEVDEVQPEVDEVQPEVDDVEPEETSSEDPSITGRIYKQEYAGISDDLNNIIAAKIASKVAAKKQEYIDRLRGI